jgi:hypothetical protein
MAQGLFTLRQVNQAIRQSAWTTGTKTSAVEYLVVGGGGGANIGGGGAGGLLTGLLPVATGSSLTVTIGAGATGTVQNGSIPIQAASSVFNSVIAYGGGGGGSLNAGIGAGNGASGGGEGGSGTGSYFSAGIATPKGQGNNGGNNNGQVGGADPGGGGGGAGTVGLSPQSTIIAGNGGAGIASSISGTVTAYAGGGGGGYWTFGSTVASTGGVGGGAGGQTGSSTLNGTNGTANTGGGGGAAVQGGVGGNGGSGVVIVSYPDVYAAPTATTGSPTVSTSGSGSLSSSSGNYLYSSTSTGLNLGTSSFTVEYWVYFNAITGAPTPVCLGTAGANPLFGNVNSGVLGLFLSGSSPPWDIASNVTIGTVTTGTWYHVAVVRNGNTFYTFLNGAQGATFTSSQSIYQTSNVMGIGVGEGGNYPLNGYVTNVRLLKGTALYTSAFTPPTAPLTAITNTSILFNSVSGAPFVDGSGNSLTMTATGSPAWNALSPFTGTGYKNRVYKWTSSGSITF